jgi:hypothetical protein
LVIVAAVSAAAKYDGQSRNNGKANAGRDAKIIVGHFPDPPNRALKLASAFSLVAAFVRPSSPRASRVQMLHVLFLPRNFSIGEPVSKTGFSHLAHGVKLQVLFCGCPLSAISESIKN